MCNDSHSSVKERRYLLKMLGAAGASMLLFRCGDNNKFVSATNSDTTSSSSDNGTTASGSCTVTATEVNGPYPADGSNSAGDGNSAVLDDVYDGSPIVRNSIAESISGVPLALTLSLQNVNNSCATLSGYYIYVWHCTPDGEYSAYTGSTNGGTHSRTETYCRGIAQTDSNGNVTFSSVYPGWYSGRAVHIHCEVYSSLSASSPVKITQFCFPMSVNNVVQASSGYPGTSGLMANSSDGMFSDGTTTEMLTVTGSVASGYSASLTLRVAV